MAKHYIETVQHNQIKVCYIEIRSQVTHADEISNNLDTKLLMWTKHKHCILKAKTKKFQVVSPQSIKQHVLSCAHCR